jgi:endonuclease YncB( thermonuclease family)
MLYRGSANGCRGQCLFDRDKGESELKLPEMALDIIDAQPLIWFLKVGGRCAMRALAVILVLMGAAPSSAADVIVHDGDSLTLGNARYRLHGIDSPELDQVCLDENGGVWACGIQARDRLKEFIGERQVHCDDKGPDPSLPQRRRVGECRVRGEQITLHQWLVRQGWALNFEPDAKGLYKGDQEQARVSLSGLWRGCFTTPQDFRLGNKGTANLLGPSCAALDDKRKRVLLFPDYPPMPPGCTIKGKFALRAQITSHRGIYHMQGCRSYQRTKSPDRWFCSEADAQAAGFRKAYVCTGIGKTAN